MCRSYPSTLIYAGFRRPQGHQWRAGIFGWFLISRQNLSQPSVQSVSHFGPCCILWSLTQKALSRVSAKMKTGDPIQAPWIPAQARGNSFDAAPCPSLKMLDFARLRWEERDLGHAPPTPTSRCACLCPLSPSSRTSLPDRCKHEWRETITIVLVFSFIRKCLFHLQEKYQIIRGEENFPHQNVPLGIRIILRWLFIRNSRQRRSSENQEETFNIYKRNLHL